MQSFWCFLFHWIWKIEEMQMTTRLVLDLYRFIPKNFFVPPTSLFRYHVCEVVFCLLFQSFWIDFWYRVDFKFKTEAQRWKGAKLRNSISTIWIPFSGYDHHRIRSQRQYGPYLKTEIPHEKARATNWVKYNKISVWVPGRLWIRNVTG